MKKILKLSIRYFLIVLFSISVKVCLADDPPPAPDGGSAGGHDLGGNQGEGTGVPIDGGLGIFILLGAAYGVRKTINSKHNHKVILRVDSNQTADDENKDGIH
ncbi:MAG: hypothetical protein WCL00_14140 [Bacteroidota bacterium]